MIAALEHYTFEVQYVEMLVRKSWAKQCLRWEEREWRLPYDEVEDTLCSA